MTWILMLVMQAYLDCARFRAKDAECPANQFAALLNYELVDKYAKGEPIGAPGVPGPDGDEEASSYTFDSFPSTPPTDVVTVWQVAQSKGPKACLQSDAGKVICVTPDKSRRGWKVEYK
jgi:hypothetical protein